MALLEDDIDSLVGSSDRVGTPEGVGRDTSSGASASTQGGPIVRIGNVGDATAFEASSLSSRQMAFWMPTSRSADGDILPEKDIQDARTRDVMRNDALVAGGVRIAQDQIVGSMYMLNAKPMTKLLFGKEDETWENEFQEEVEARFMLWAEGADNWSDAARMKSLTAQIRLVVGVHGMRGETLTAFEWLDNEDDSRRPFYTAANQIDIDRLSTPGEHMSDDKVRGGVRRDRFGAPQATTSATRIRATGTPGTISSSTSMCLSATLGVGR